MNLPTKAALAAVLILSACTVGGGASGGARKTASGGTSTSTSTGTGTGIPRSVTVTWTANREKAVNSAGGGYRVYYSRTNGFSTGSASAVPAPYVSGSTAPVTATIPNLTSGTYYYRVVAYSALNPGGAASSQYSFVVP